MNIKDRDSIKIIQDAINSNKLVLFVGSGISANSGLPSWDDLICGFLADLGINREIRSTEDYLTISQWYHNKFGEEKYFSKINEFFSNTEYLPNDIHDLLFDLNPQHIITTNFDSLLEKAAEKNHENFSIIKDDKDFPLAENNKMIIKMHGDLERKNIVLKENDYIEYSKKFTLIETFVKGLFSTNTVMLVGYSLRDPNVKQIFHWIKDVLKGEQRKAFLLQIDDIDNKSDFQEEDKILSDYYEKQGIIVLNYSKIQSELEKFTNLINDLSFNDIKGEKLYNTLFFIKYYFEEEAIIDNFNEKLNLLQPFNYILPKDISKIIRLYDFKANLSDIWGGEYLVCESPRFKKLVETIETTHKNTKSIKKLFSLLQKANIKSIGYNENFEERHAPLSIEIPQKTELKLTKANILLFNFNYIEINSILKDFKASCLNENSVNIFEKAYLFFGLGKYLEAFEELGIISVSSFNKKNYLIYALSQINRKLCSKRISFHKLFEEKYKNNNNADKALKESAKIDINKLINKILPQNYRTILEKKINYMYVYDSFIANTNRLDNINNLFSKAEHKFYTSDLYWIKYNTQQFFNFLNSNYLFINTLPAVGEINLVEGIYHSYIEALLLLYEIKDKDIIEKIGKDKIEAFSYLPDLYLMIKHLSPNDLKDLFEKYNIKFLKLSKKEVYFNNKETKNVLLDSFYNLVNSIKLLKLEESFFFDYLRNFFIILAKIKLSEKEISSIIDSFLEIDINRTDLIDGFKEFLDGIFQIDQNLISNENLDKLIYYCLKKQNEKDSRNYMLFGHEELLAKCVVLFNIKDRTYTLSEKIHKELYIYFKRTTFVHDFDFYRIRDIFIPIYNIVVPEMQNSIKEKSTLSLENCFMPIIYIDCCLENIINPQENYENKLIQLAEQLIKQKNNTKDSIELSVIQETLQNRLKDIAILIMNDKIINKAKFSKYKSLSPVLDFVLDYTNFDYKKFEINFLSILRKENKEDVIKFLKENPEIKQKVIKTFKDNFEIKDEKSDVLKNTFFSLFFD